MDGSRNIHGAGVKQSAALLMFVTEVYIAQRRRDSGGWRLDLAATGASGLSLDEQTCRGELSKRATQTWLSFRRGIRTMHLANCNGPERQIHPQSLGEHGSPIRVHRPQLGLQHTKPVLQVAIPQATLNGY